MDDPDAVDVILRAAPDERPRPGRAFLGDDAVLFAPGRHGRLARAVGGAADGLFGGLLESLGLYDPHAVTRTEATHDPDAVRVRYGDVEGLAPFARPTGFSLHLRVAGREDDVRLAFRSADERADAVSLARELRRRARAAGADPEVVDPGGRTRVLSLEE
ncbi:hypothetical protein Hbl1158_03830 [Halobaculum sp. CBA1158]|uniref:hypothetical protein n=1 Tax=Halobaculum sp. CBA1158 TaxID=2904243 RepID=UPI001F3A5281|nr:hypothetical protein [Halobaculum sp. CBA1158]UIP00502.1 hypothetical protein Hbl1158_03830 [Halobaculum sp. CBA1158]